MSTDATSQRHKRRTVALVPARGGSKSIPRKNLRTLGNKPLVAWPIGTAQATAGVDETYVTTDSDEIASAARDHGASIINRPAEHATDDALVIDAVRHAIDKLSQSQKPPDRMVLLEPTCPFRISTDVQQCLDILAEGYDSVATFTEAEVNPHRTWQLAGDQPSPFIQDANPWLPRQQLPEAYQLNGGCYAFETAAVRSATSDNPSLLFGEAGSIRMPPERSVDIDSPVDLIAAQTMISEGNVDHP